MYPSIKRTALSLCLVASIATPVWAGDTAPASNPSVIMAPIAAPDYKEVPWRVTVDGKDVNFDLGTIIVHPVMSDQGPVLVNPMRAQGPGIVDGVLFVPVRAIAEAAGGVVTWDNANRLTQVRMPARTIMIKVGQQEAEMQEDGVSYLTRNVVQMKKAPVLMGERTLVSADALTTIFGFQVTLQADGTLALTSPTKPAVAPVETTPPAVDIERGSVSRWETDAHKRFLLAGAPMSNGEPTLSWVAVTEKTKITVQEGDKTRAGSESDITDGVQVEVTWDGMRAMSYPAQGAAAEIVVHK
jgi:hypothetical protein